MEVKKTRLEELEILRGIAFLAVVLQHAFAGIFILPNISSTELTIGATLLGIIRFAVPLFVFITGVVLFYNYDGKINYIQFINKRFVQVIIPYITWTLFYYVWISFLSGFSPSSTWLEIVKIFKLIFTGEASYHLWFMVMIIPFYLLFPIFRLLMSKERKYLTNFAVVISIFIINIFMLFALSKDMIQYSNDSFIFFFNYLDRNFIFWTFYFILGGFVGLYYGKWKNFVNKFIIFCVVFLAVYLYFVYIEIKNINLIESNYLLSAQITDPLKPITMLAATTSIIIIFFFAQKLLSRYTIITKYLKVFGEFSFGAYLIHAFVLRFTNDFVINHLSIISPFAQTFVSFVLCSVFSLALCYLISKVKIPTGEIVVGKV
ncbi:acyltransferase [Lysinibacillus sp. LZ02]|uniref:acyltransferase n=1 Tax=Lysinibacillus sp. LZ02 TaxID=3420668 RepID=UPI003D367645